METTISAGQTAPGKAMGTDRDLGLLGLALAAGGVDAATYLGLGRAFPANMTGNTVLLGVAVARGAAWPAPAPPSRWAASRLA